MLCMLVPKSCCVDLFYRHFLKNRLNNTYYQKNEFGKHKFHKVAHTLSMISDAMRAELKTLGIDTLDEICRFVQAEVKTRLRNSISAADPVVIVSNNKHPA